MMPAKQKFFATLAALRVPGEYLRLKGKPRGTLRRGGRIWERRASG